MKILMVCLGNICRSPMAEGLMKAKIEKYHLYAEADSAGFESFHTGDPPDRRALQTMKNHGIDISSQRSRMFRATDFDRFDYIYVMDHNNYSDVHSMSEHNEQMAKVDYILNVINPNRNQPVPDPYYGGNEGFEKVYQLLDEATERIALKLLENQ
jgi:protein-tyrosine phosphatase